MLVLNRVRAAEGEPAVRFGLALHIGEVMFGNIGASQRLDFTVIGPAVNHAARLEKLCSPLDRSVVLSASMAELLPADEIEPLGPARDEGHRRTAEHLRFALAHRIAPLQCAQIHDAALDVRGPIS